MFTPLAIPKSPCDIAEMQVYGEEEEEDNDEMTIQMAAQPTQAHSRAADNDTDVGKGPVTSSWLFMTAVKTSYIATI